MSLKGLIFFFIFLCVCGFKQCLKFSLAAEEKLQDLLDVFYS